MQLDIPTLIVMEIASAVLVGAILPSARDAREVAGLRDLTISYWLLAGSFVFQLLRGKVPEVLPIVFGNGLLAVAVALQARAYARYDGRVSLPRWPLPFAVAATLLLIGLWFVGAAYPVRAALSALTTGVFTVYCTWVLARDGGLRLERSRSICIGLCAFTALCMMARIVVLVVAPPADANMLKPSLERTIAFFPTMLYTLGGGMGFLVMHRERSDARSRTLALTDPMTGCANRRALEDRVRGELDHSNRSRRPISIIVSDIDRFKSVNDTHGHSVGDLVIQHVAAIFRKGVRTSDVVARYGGEEFCVLLREADGAVAEMLAERLRTALHVSPVVAPEIELRVTSSFGVATFVPGNGETWESLFRRADAALYRAKQSGRDRVEVCTNPPPPSHR